ncbi:MAG: ParB N-terminal domain-containing protein [Trichococcus flocculiformis]|uniref:ParB N-terminal domain-containing protein n=1 Tax=Trichococcus flocculiformis TaxID=82803 RepID=A0A847D748_9LACT|nr:ParB/RepB/Spo0J family partition protein [Trichococcus flocculiformis]NLD32556.1 ParB N-terminal domain-containing protein [Trichococcus flocculiformis]
MMVDSFDVSKMIENPEYSALVPEMSASEWQEFVENVKKFGIRQPITINKDLTILDGRHRVRACKELGIERIAAIVNEMDGQQAIEYVRDTAIERRSLSVEQRLDIIFKSEDLMNGLAEEAKKRQKANLRKGNENKNPPLQSRDCNGKRAKTTSDAIAEMVGTSPSSVGRFKKIRKESPEIYDEVVSGEKSILTGYKELPSVSGASYEISKRNKGLPKEEARKKVVTPMPDFGKSDEELQKEADYENLKNHLSQTLAMKVFIEDFQGAAKTLLKKEG